MKENNIERSKTLGRNKTELFIKILNHVPNNSIWGIGDISKDIWNHFKGFDAMLKFKKELTFSYSVVSPKYYFELNNESKVFLSAFLIENINIWNYIFHQMIFSGTEGLMVAFENFNIIDISNKIGIKERDIEKYKNYIPSIYISDLVFD